MYAHPRRKHLLVRDALHSLGCHRYLMTATCKGVREIKHMPLLTTNIRRKELSKKEKAHQSGLVSGFSLAEE